MMLINSKDEDILMNILKLIMTLIAKNKNETSLIGRVLAEEENVEYGKNALIKRLILLIKYGPNIPHCFFSKQVTFISISLLRAFLQHSSAVKTLIMSDKIPHIKKTEVDHIHKIFVPYNEDCFIMVLIHKLFSKNVGLIDAEIENAIYSMLI